MIPNSPIVIRASAGSGKTHELTGLFLKLLLAGSTPESILATTFTNDSAAEIIQRVLLRLLRALKSEDERKKLHGELSLEIPLENFSEEKMRTLLASLIQSSSKLLIGTLDSFFSRLAKSFRSEADIPLQWETTQNETDILSEVLLTLLNDVQQEVGSKLIGYLTQNEADFSVYVVLQKVLTGTLELIRLSSPEAWYWDLEELPAEDLLTLKSRVDRLIVPKTKENKPRKYWTDCKDKLTQVFSTIKTPQDTISSRALDDVLDLGIVKKINDRETMYDRAPIDSDWVECIVKIQEHFAPKILREYLLKTRSIHALFLQLSELYDKEIQAQGIFAFSDLPWLLQHLVSRPAEENWVYRFGQRIQHILLDEFQDTSRLQWLALKPLLEEVLSHPEILLPLFIVGDEKQAIYGWRGGCSALLEEASHLRADTLEEERVKNYRSAPVILETVNTLFAPKSIFPESKFKDVAFYGKKWLEKFSLHQAHHSTAEGAVGLYALKNEDFLEKSFELILDALELTTGTIAVLARTKNDLHELRTYLSARGIYTPPISDSNSNTEPDGTDIEGVRIVAGFADILHLLEHPADRFATVR
jgi:ATP-dependent helicase/nuclease subunit A